MPDLSLRNIAILRFIYASPDRMATVAALRQEFGANYLDRINVLSNAGLIEPSEYASDPLRPFKPSSYRLTVAGEDMVLSLQRKADEMANQKADADRQKAADAAQIELNEKKKFRHDFKVAAFSVILTLLLEHVSDVFNAVKTIVVVVRDFLVK